MGEMLRETAGGRGTWVSPPHVRRPVAGAGPGGSRRCREATWPEQSRESGVEREGMLKGQEEEGPAALRT